jgi:hypothetical protein
VFTGDNIFFHCKTFVQEADPWQWLKALDDIRALDCGNDRARSRRAV